MQNTISSSHANSGTTTTANDTSTHTASADTTSAHTAGADTTQKSANDTTQKSANDTTQKSADTTAQVKTIGAKEAKTLLLSALGGTLEFYDFVIFLFFMGYFTPHFFPQSLDSMWQELNTYGAFAAAYLARPLGGVVMAHFGDKFGRKNMFMLSILLMVIPTFVVAILPTFESIGYAAIVVLFIVRILQGIAIGGELPGAWVFVYEHSPMHSRGLFLGLLTCGVAGGILLGCIVKLCLQLSLSPQQLSDWAWRVPFAIGGVFGICSVFLRRHLSETPVFAKLREQNALESFPLARAMREYRHGVALSMMMTCVLTACVMVLLLLMPNYVPKLISIDDTSNTVLQMGGVCMMLVGLALSGALGDSFGASGVCKVFAVGLFVFCGLYFYGLYEIKDAFLVVVFYMLACFFSGIVGFAAIFMTGVFASGVRFSGISFSYNLAYAIAGAITPVLLFRLHTMSLSGQWAFGGGVYLCAIGVLAYICAVYYNHIKLESN